MISKKQGEFCFQQVAEVLHAVVLQDALHHDPVARLTDGVEYEPGTRESVGDGQSDGNGAPS